MNTYTFEFTQPDGQHIDKIQALNVQVAEIKLKEIYVLSTDFHDITRGLDHDTATLH